MRLPKLTSLLPFLALTLPVSLAFELSAYTGIECRSASLEEWIGGEDQGCQEPISWGTAQSVVIESTGAVDNSSYAVFFSSDDCDPDTEVNDGKGHFDDGCYTGEYKSFAIWDVNNK